MELKLLYLDTNKQYLIYIKDYFFYYIYTKMGRKPIYKTPEEKKEALRRKAREFIQKDPERHRQKSMEYYNQNKAIIAERRKKKRDEVKQALLKLKRMEEAMK